MTRNCARVQNNCRHLPAPSAEAELGTARFRNRRSETLPAPRRGPPDETMVERPQIARLLAARPTIKGDRLPGRDGVTVARRADRSPLGLDRGRARCSSALRPVTPRHGPRAPIKRSADCTRLVSAFTDPVVLVKAAAKALRELPCTLPQRRIEGGVKSLASLDESVRGTFAPAREVKGVVAPVPGTGVKAYSAQLFGRLRVFLAAIGTNHDDARGRLHFSDAIVAHRYSFRMAPPRIHRAANREHSTKREKPASGPDGLSRPIFRILVSRFRSSLAARS